MNNTVPNPQNTNDCVQRDTTNRTAYPEKTAEIRTNGENKSQNVHKSAGIGVTVASTAVIIVSSLTARRYRAVGKTGRTTTISPDNEPFTDDDEQSNPHAETSGKSDRCARPRVCHACQRLIRGRPGGRRSLAGEPLCGTAECRERAPEAYAPHRTPMADADHGGGEVAR